MQQYSLNKLNMKKTLLTSIFILLGIFHSSAFGQYIDELKIVQETAQKENSFCKGVNQLLTPIANQGHPEALIALGDAYDACVKEAEPKKFITLFEIYGRAASEKTKTSGSMRGWHSHGRLWAYERLSNMMISAEKIPNYSSSTYSREIQALAVSAAFLGDAGRFFGSDGALCWRARNGGYWLKANGCSVISSIATDYAYPKSEGGHTSPFKTDPYTAMLWQYHAANETYGDKEEVKYFFEYANLALKKNRTFTGNIMCTGKSDSVAGGIQALRQSLTASPYFGTCQYKKWQLESNQLDIVSYTDGGILAEILDKKGSKTSNTAPKLFAIIDPISMKELAIAAGKELKINITDEKEMTKLIDDTYDKLKVNLAIK
jgi:hypothetical protein